MGTGLFVAELLIVRRRASGRSRPQRDGAASRGNVDRIDRCALGDKHASKHDSSLDRDCLITGVIDPLPDRIVGERRRNRGRHGFELFLTDSLHLRHGTILVHG